MFTQTYVQSTQTASPRNLGEQGVHLMWISLWDWLMFCLLALFPFCADYSLSLRLSLFSLELVPLHFKPSTAFSLTFTPHHKSISSALFEFLFFFFPDESRSALLSMPTSVWLIFYSFWLLCTHAVTTAALVSWRSWAVAKPGTTDFLLSTSKVLQAPPSSTPLSSKAFQASLRNIDLTSNCGQYQMLQRNKTSCTEKYARICYDQMDKAYN